MALFYELVIFTASLSKYAQPLMQQLDPNKHCGPQLYREHCTFFNGVFVKDLSRLGRDLKDVIILDNSPYSYHFHPENGMAIKNWYDDKSDQELLHYIPLLERLAFVEDVRAYIPQMIIDNSMDYKKAIEAVRNVSFKSGPPEAKPSKRSASQTVHKRESKYKGAEANERKTRPHSHDRRKKQPHQNKK